MFLPNHKNNIMIVNAYARNMNSKMTQNDNANNKHVLGIIGIC